MELTAKQVANLISGEIIGDANVIINRLSKIEEATAGSLTFLANPQYTHFIYEKDASIVIVNKTFLPEKNVSSTLIKVENVYQGFGKLLEIFDGNKKQKTGIEQPSYISKTARLGENVYVGTFAYIGENVSIGNNTKIYPNVFIGDDAVIKDNTILYAGVKIYHRCEIGNNCTIHSGAVIGADGFGFFEQSGHSHKKITQIGNVVIEDNVEIGANTTIDRATLGSTIIRKGVKIDNLVQIAHNIEIGENTVIAAQVGIAGSTKIGKNCMIGGQVGIIGHLTIADGVKIAAQSGIAASITKKGEIVQGSPAFPIKLYRKSYVLFRKLPELYKKILDIETSIKKK